MSESVESLRRYYAMTLALGRAAGTEPRAGPEESALPLPRKHLYPTTPHFEPGTRRPGSPAMLAFRLRSTGSEFQPEDCFAQRGSREQHPMRGGASSMLSPR